MKKGAGCCSEQLVETCLHSTREKKNRTRAWPVAQNVFELLLGVHERERRYRSRTSPTATSGPGTTEHRQAHRAKRRRHRKEETREAETREEKAGKPKNRGGEGSGRKRHRRLPQPTQSADQLTPPQAGPAPPPKREEGPTPRKNQTRDGLKRKNHYPVENQPGR